MPKTPAGSARLSRRKWDYDAGFALSMEGATYAEIAARFGVSEMTVKDAARRERWAERRAVIEERARRTVDRKAEKTVADRIRENLQLISASKLVYARGLKEGATTISASEMAALMKVEALLTGGATERLAPESDGARRSLETIEQELSELDPAEVDAMIEADAAVAERLELPPGEPTTPREPEPDASLVSMPDAASEPPTGPADVEAEAVEEPEPERPDGMTPSEWRAARENADAWMTSPEAKSPLERALGVSRRRDDAAAQRAAGWL